MGEQIRAFIQKEADLKEQQFLVPVQSLDFDRVDHDDNGKEETESVTPAQSTTNALVNKKAATGYTLNFDDDEEQQNGDEEEAIKWFKRFNQREPDQEELAQIEQFMKVDQGGDEEEEDANEDMVDIE